MATTISVETMIGGGMMPRVSINGHQFIETETMIGGGMAPDAMIGSKRQVLNVKGWTPDQDDFDVAHGQSVTANVEATNTAELEVLYDEGADFQTGTLDDMEIVGDELHLKTTPYEEDWEGVTPLNNWTLRFTGSPSLSIIDDGSGDNNVLRKLNWNKTTLLSADDGPNASDVVLKARWQIKNKWDAYPGLAARITGSATACRGYCLLYQEDTGSISLRRITGDGSTFLIGFNGSPGVPEVQEDEWCNLALRVVGSDFRFKIWMEPDPEPGSWTWIATDSVHSGPGDCGIWTRHSSGNEVLWWDDFSAETVPPVYQNNGSWIDFIDVTSVDHYSHAMISWDETEPALTNVSVAVRWPGDTLYQVQTVNPDRLKGIAYEQDMRAGSTKHTLEIKVSMTTTDPDVTPTLSNLRVYFEPGRAEEFDLTVHGVVGVPADGSLAWWGRGWIGASGVPPTLEADWSDLWFQTTRPWMARDYQVVAAALEYWGNAIDDITFEAEGSKYRHGYLKAYWSVPVTPFYSGGNVFEYTVLKEWFQMGHAYEWLIIDKGQAIHADARWLVGHYQLDNFPGSLLVALPNVSNFPGSLLVKGYQLDNFMGSLLVQGWRFDNFPGSVLPGVRYLYNFPGSSLVAVAHHQNFPGSVLVFGVDREGQIEVNVVSDETWAELTARGYTQS